MADGLAVTPGSGATVAAELISAQYLQRVKVVLGDLDADAGDVASDNPMPCTVSGVATAAHQTAEITALGTLVTNSPALGQAVASGCVPVVLPTAQITSLTPPTSVTVLSGTAGNLLAQVSGSVTAVSGTAGNLLAQVSGSVTAVSGTAGNFLSQVSGSVTAVSGTAANLLASVTGTVGINTTVVVSSGTAANFLTLSTITAGTNSIGQVISGQQMSIFNGTAALTVNYAAVSFTASAGNTIVAAVGSKNIYILSGLLIAQAATNLQWFSGTTAGTAISGVMCMTANQGYQIPYVPIGNMATQATNSAITLSSSVATTVGGWVTYVAL